MNELPDLPLDLILRFVPGEDYLHVNLVCRRWQELLQRRVPSCVMGMSVLSTKYKGSNTVPNDCTYLLSRTFQHLRDETSCLYRGHNNDNDDEHLHWPKVKPCFNLTIMIFIHKRVERYQAYEATLSFLETWAQETVTKLWNILEQQNNNTNSPNSQALLSGFNKIWMDWQGIVSTIAGTCWLLERYNKSNPASFQEHANVFLAKSLANTLVLNYDSKNHNVREDDDSNQETSDEKDSIHKELELYLLTGKLSSSEDEEASTTTPSSSFSFKDRALSILACISCAGVEWKDGMLHGRQVEMSGDVVVLEKPLPRLVSSMTANLDDHRVLEFVTSCLQTVEQQEREEKAEQRYQERLKDRPVHIETSKHDKTVAPPHFIGSSTTLRNLGLQGGETIRVDVTRDVLEKVIDFYEIVERESYTAIPNPTTQTQLANLGVAPAYVQFQEMHLKQPEPALEILKLALVLGLTDLVDFASFCIAQVLVGLNRNALRDLFDIQGDF